MDNASNSNMRPLFLLQKTTMRIITYSNKRTQATPLFSRLQILKLRDIFQLELAKLMHKVHNKALNICSASTNNYVFYHYIKSFTSHWIHRNFLVLLLLPTSLKCKCLFLLLYYQDLLTILNCIQPAL